MASHERPILTGASPVQLAVGGAPARSMGRPRPRLLGAGLAPLPPRPRRPLSGVVIILIVLTAFIGAPLAAHILGARAERHQLERRDQLRAGRPLDARAKDQNGNPTLYVLGASDAVGRDEFLRMLSGARVSLEVAVFATMIGLFVGIVSARSPASTAV